MVFSCQNSTSQLSKLLQNITSNSQDLMASDLALVTATVKQITNEAAVNPEVIVIYLINVLVA